MKAAGRRRNPRQVRKIAQQAATAKKLSRAMVRTAGPESPPAGGERVEVEHPYQSPLFGSADLQRERRLF